jgi:uncharacterized membrane protein YGL010W
MISFIDRAQSCAAFHQSPSSRYLQGAGILLIILSLMILLGFIRIIIIDVLNINLASVATLAVLVYYFRLHWRLALAVTPFFIVLLWMAELFTQKGPTKFALWSFIIIFAVGCIIQFFGYFFTDRKPSFKEVLNQLLLAPLISTANIIFMAGRMKRLKEEIYGHHPNTKIEGTKHLKAAHKTKHQAAEE